MIIKEAFPMKETTKMSRAISQLEHIYNSLNTDFWSGELPVPVITVQSKPGTYGHCTTSKVWQRKTDNTYELNIAAEVLSYPIEEIIDTMLHEMTHLFCREHGFKETSRGSAYHNKKFKEIAESHGLTCVYQGAKNGWNTTPGDNLIEYAIKKGWNEIKINRNTFRMLPLMESNGTPQYHGASVTAGHSQKSSHKLICPKCGQIARSTRPDFKLICGYCIEPMVEQ